MADIKFSGTADFSQVEKSYAKLEADTKRLEDQALRLSRAAESGGTAQQRAAERATEAAAKARASVDQLGSSIGKTGDAGAKSGDEIKKAFDGATRDVAKLEGANNRLRKSVEDTAAKQSEGGNIAKQVANDGIGQIKALAMEWVTFSGIVETANSAIQKVGENNKKALEAHLQQAPAEELVIKNLVGISPQQKREVLDQLDQMAKEIGVEAAPLKRAFAEAISKAGGDIPLALESTRAAAGIHRLSPDQMSTTTAAGATLSRVLGIQDPRQALGFANSFQASTAEANQQIVMGVLPGAVGAVLSSVPKQDKRRGAEEAAAVLAALNQANSAPGLASASTAEVGLASQLKQFFQPAPLSDEEKDVKTGQKGKLLSRVRTLQENKKGDRPEIVQAQIQKARAQIAMLDREIAGMGVAEDPGTFAGRIAAIQQNEDLQNRIIPNIHGEAAFVDAMKDLLRGKQDSRVMQEYTQNLTRIRVGSSGYEQQAKELSIEQGLTRAVRLAAKTQKDAAEADETRMGRGTAAEKTRIKKKADEVLDESQLTFHQAVGAKLATPESWVDSATQSRQQASINALRRQAEQIRLEAGIREGGIGNLNWWALTKPQQLLFNQRSVYKPATDEQLNEEEREQVAKLERTAKQLEEELADVNAKVKVSLPEVVPEDAAPMAAPTSTAPVSTAAAAAERSNAYRALPSVDDVLGSAGSAQGDKKVRKAAQRETREEKTKLTGRLKSIERELAGHGPKLKKPGYREELQREAEQLRGQISDVERNATEVLLPSHPPAAAASPPVAGPAADQTAMIDLQRRLLDETSRSNQTMRLLTHRLGSAAARQDLLVAVG